MILITNNLQTTRKPTHKPAYLDILMSSFKLSPEAKVFTPILDTMMELTREKLKNRRLSDENNALKEKIKILEDRSENDQKIIKAALDEIDDKKETIKENKEHYYSVISSLEEDLKIIKEQNDGNAENCLRIIGDWQGRSVRLNWIIKEMERVGAIKGDHEWAQDLRRSIEFPNDDGINLGESVYREIPNDILLRNLPNYMDSHMEEIDEDTENDRIEEWSIEASSFVEQEKISACIKIQKMWRKNRINLDNHWIDRENDNIFGELFDEDERAYTLEYLEWKWKDMYRKHYDLGLFDRIPYDKITLSCYDFTALSRGSL